jgi:hypothetical protein
LEEEEITRNNYTCYYQDAQGHKSKIIIRNDGRDGYQHKHKSKSVEKGKTVRIKEEDVDTLRQNLQEAEADLPEAMRSDPTLIIKTLKHKLTLLVHGDDDVTRYYRLIVDQTSLPENEENKLCQIELEYKGSDHDEEDNLETIKSEMTRILEEMRSVEEIGARPTNKSKFKWGKKQQRQ